MLYLEICQNNSQNFATEYIYIVGGFGWTLRRRVPTGTVWLSGNTLVLIIVITLQQTWLVSGWVTVFRVNDFGAELGTQVY